MSNEGEKRCPLCAEEMDWTDQQFKPCKCGYQVCVWCWHQIMDMAEKDESEGRCPACRSAYEKDKIVAMQRNCERAVMKNCNKKSKPLKAKPKTTEVKKELTSVRVIQRKMAYIIGLPLSVADENIAPVYLASCMKQGLGLLETLLNKQPVQHHQVLLKVEYAKVLS